ncbi:MAG: SDR family oxidoreductase [Comamonadaceae bacterium]|nr:SDR family oxidoreductase [Comamonadaceae bacterium]
MSAGTPAPLAFITGASSGIGQALAAHYQRAGWRVALVARRPAELAAWATQQGWPADRWRAYGADVTRPDSIAAAARACLGELGLPDVVIASAGISIGMDSAEFDDLDVMTRTFATNNVGLAATFQPFVRAMRARGSGRLVGVASVAGVRGLPGHGAYCASKAGVIRYCESLRAELHGSGVRVVTLLPGFIDTPMTRHNPYPMPFLMPADAFARRAAAAIAAGARQRVIPWPMGIVAWLLPRLPGAWLDSLLARRPRKPRQGADAAK